jgi:hypothetical protein
MKNLIKKLLPLLELLFLIPLIISAFVLKLYRRVGSKNLKLSTNILKKIGVFPIRDHYYEPLFNDKYLANDLRKPRNLVGIDFNEKEQIKLLKQLTYQNDFDYFLKKEINKSDFSSFKIDNGSFDSGDAEFLFNFVRYIKPKKIIEVGCGESTKIIQSAIKLNNTEQVEESICSHVCIEPYEQPWLESFSNINLIRDKVESLDFKLFQGLEDGDLLFIDSSHIIRPQGDVLWEYLSIIPNLPKGVYVHVHDIFSPNDYPNSWIKEQVLFWNEQYLLEALLTGSDKLEVVAALNFLKHNYYKDLKKVCPYLNQNREPGSFYFRTK